MTERIATSGSPLSPPEGLPPAMLPVWEELAKQVRPAIGRIGMESLCSQVMRMRDAQERIGREGLVVADSKGNPVPHPGLAIERAAQAAVLAWLKRYGRGGQ